MTQVVQAKCPFCENVLRIPADWLAQPMRCKFCKQVIQAKPAASNLATAVTAGAANAAVAPPEAATAVAPSAAPRRSSGDPFSFDDEPEPAAAPQPRRSKNGKGLWIATGLLVLLSAAAVFTVVFFGSQLRDYFLAQTNGEPPGPSGDKAPAAEKGTQPKNGTREDEKAPARAS